MINRILLLAALVVSGQVVHAQQGDCKVLVPDIADSYAGGCKNGLAQGRGIAQGTDHYEGQFFKGKPFGKGIYTWKDGTHYEGQWKDGMRDGKGKMVYRDSVVTGYWSEDRYIGEKLVSPFTITNTLGVTRYTINRVSVVGNDIRIKILQGGQDNLGIEDFSIYFDSGEEYRSGAGFGIQNVRFPLDVKIKYRTWNQLHTVQFDVIFEFTMLQPGTWQVNISN